MNVYFTQELILTEFNKRVCSPHLPPVNLVMDHSI